MRKSVWAVLLALALALSIFIGLGVVFNKPQNEKQQGLTEVFDVSPNGMLAYVVYDKGKAGIYLQHDSESFDNPVLQLNETQEIVNIDFSSDGTSLAFVTTNKEGKADLASTVHLFTIASLEAQELFVDDGLITELAFDPKEEDVLFYLRAGTFENYSPIANARPHDIDLYSYNISSHEHSQLTKLLAYSMDSLNISSTSAAAYVQMMDDGQAKTAEDIFEATQKVFQIPLDGSGELSIISEIERTTDIYDFVVIPNENELIFQSVSQTGENGIYEYELFLYNWETGEERQLTRLKEYTGRPKIDSGNEKVFFIVDRQFGKRQAAYELYKMDIDGGNIEAVGLEL